MVAVDIQALWDEVRDMLNDDVTLQNLLGNDDLERVVVGFSTKDVDTKVTASKGLVLLSSPDMGAIYMQSTATRIITTCYSAYQKDVNAIAVQVRTLLNKYKPTLVWCQQLVIETQGGVSVTGVSDNKQQVFVRDTYVAQSRNS